MSRYRNTFTSLVLGLSAVLHAQTTPPAATVVNPTSAPTAAVTTTAVPAKPTGQLPASKPQSTVPDLLRYLNNPSLLIFCTSQVAAFNDRDADIIFIGDSITQNWLSQGKDVWDKEFAPRNALDFGISGDQTQHVLWRMQNYPIARLHPKVAVILIGTNNQGNTPEEIAAGVQAVIAKTQAMFPGIRIILNSIMPNRRNNALMMSANEHLRTMADGNGVVYLDLVPLMTPVGDNWKGLGPDHLHPDETGYRLWADALLPVLDHMLTPSAAVQ
jgi:lysophospholipase L1-like esterase